ncbi:Xaa-Pro aminopeptidase [Glaciecola siphonariae]|uniref:Xaa-Pro aminopeptidase n=1 Tax=Glaciecola siphonariae TaxID=521012 RepID=A0ABV9LUQ9_9ALTE
MISIDEFRARRASLIEKCAPSSLVIVPAASAVTRSNDTEYPFRQDSDFFYLTGFAEPDAFLLLSNQLAGSQEPSASSQEPSASSQKPSESKANATENTPFASMMFVLPKDQHAEIWHGRRLGVQAAPDALGIDEAFSIDEIDELLAELINGHEHLYFSLDKYPQADAVVQAALAQCKAAPKQSMLAPSSIVDVDPLIHAMRRIKSDAELQIMRKAASISVDAHLRAMRFCQPGVWEYQLAAEIHHEFAMRGACAPAYSSIVGSGENACILHYTENSKAIEDGDLVLIDAGCELQGYAADITRTFPANGTFTEAQKALYELVLDAQLAALTKLVPGSTIADAMQECVHVITHGLLRLGILKGTFSDLLEQEAWRPYFMHGLGHYLGLDVHDVGKYKQQGKDIPLSPGVVITVEPGLYIAPNSPAPKQYHGIGIRIEDDIVITESGHEILTSALPKEVSAIEALMSGRQSSA